MKRPLKTFTKNKNSNHNMATKKKTFIVAVCRTAYAFRDIEVQATSEKEALELALDDAGNHEFSEKSSEYTTDGLREK